MSSEPLTMSAEREECLRVDNYGNPFIAELDATRTKLAEVTAERDLLAGIIDAIRAALGKGEPPSATRPGDGG